MSEQRPAPATFVARQIQTDNANRMVGNVLVNRMSSDDDVIGVERVIGVIQTVGHALVQQKSVTN